MAALMLKLMLTIIVSVGGGLLLYRLKIPAGAMIGAILFSAVFQITTGMGFFPQIVKVLVQALAGGFIGQRIMKNDLLEMRKMIKPSLEFFIGILVLSLGMGVVIHSVSDIDIATALISSVPGGISDMAMISLDVGADPPQATALQLVRYLVSLMLLPNLAAYICRRYAKEEMKKYDGALPGGKSKEIKTLKNMSVTLLILSAAGLLGKISRFPAGALVFALFAVAAFNIKTERAYLPKSVRVGAQLCAGTIVGVGIGMEDILGFTKIIVPALLVVLNCFLINYALGYLIYKTNHLDLPTCLFSAIPSGISDMALISSEMGGDAPKVTVLQLVRYLGVMSVMPTLIKLIAAVYPF